jgi:tetratricopeptide (TPR) repeat protein
MLVAMRAVELSLADPNAPAPADDVLATLSQAKQEELADEIANLRLRVLLRKVGQAPRAAGRDLWRGGLEGLAAPSYLTAAVLGELDHMAARTRVDDPALAMDVATDLFLMGTDTASLRAIQQRRVALLAGQARWEEVSQAAKLEAVLAAWSCEALVPTITGGADALLAAGMDAQTVQSVVDQQVETMGGMAAEPAGAAGLLDDSLQAAVLERRKQGRAAPPRQQALLLALSQEPDAAAKAGVQVPAAHTGGVAQLESQALLWSLAQGRVALPPASPPDPRADSQPAAGRGDLVGLRQERLVRWGAEALKAKREAWAATLWNGALAMARDDDQLASLTRAMVGKGLAGSRPKDLLGAMTKMMEAQRAGLPKVLLLQRMAEIQYAFRDYRNAGAYLDQAQAACGPATPPAITAAMKLDQAACLINQGQWEAARALLGAQPDPRGTPWQQATAMFLTGLTKFHGCDVAGAVAAFREGARLDPQHPFAAQADQMARRVEACGVGLSSDTVRCSAPEYARQNMEPLRSALTQQAPPQLGQRLELVGELFDRLAQAIDQQQTEALAAMVPPVLGLDSGGGSAAAPMEVLGLYHEFAPKFDQSSVGTDLPEEQKAHVAEQYMELSRRTEMFVRDRAAMVSALDPARRTNMLALAATVLLLHVGDGAFGAEHVAALPEWMKDPLALGELGEVCLAGRRPLTALCIEQSRTGTTWDLDAQGAYLEGRAMWVSPPADRRAQLAALEAWVALADRAGVDVRAMSARSGVCEFLGKTGSSGLAAEVMRRQVERYPQSKTYGQAATLRLKYLCANRNYETLISEAAPCLKDERCRDQYPQILYLAWMAGRSGGNKSAANTFGDQLLSGYSDNPLCAAVWLDCGLNYLAMGDYEKAREALRTVLEKFPTSASVSEASKLLASINQRIVPPNK